MPQLSLGAYMAMTALMPVLATLRLVEPMARLAMPGGVKRRTSGRNADESLNGFLGFSHLFDVRLHLRVLRIGRGEVVAHIIAQHKFL